MLFALVGHTQAHRVTSSPSLVKPHVKRRLQLEELSSLLDSRPTFSSPSTTAPTATTSVPVTTDIVTTTEVITSTEQIAVTEETAMAAENLTNEETVTNEATVTNEETAMSEDTTTSDESATTEETANSEETAISAETTTTEETVMPEEAPTTEEATTTEETVLAEDASAAQENIISEENTEIQTTLPLPASVPATGQGFYPCHSAKSVTSSASCSRVVVPPKLCKRCPLRAVARGGQFLKCSNIFDTSADGCLEAMEEYVELNECDGDRRKAVAAWKNGDNSGRSAVDYFLYSLCETCCDCAPPSTEQSDFRRLKNAHTVDTPTLWSTRRGNCAAHAWYDVRFL